MSDGSNGGEAPLLFVDAIEDDDAYLVVGEKRFVVPRTMLPMGVGEGAWLRIVPVDNPAVVREIKARRSRLLESDPGGDIKL